MNVRVGQKLKFIHNIANAASNSIRFKEMANKLFGTTLSEGLLAMIFQMQKNQIIDNKGIVCYMLICLDSYALTGAG